MADTLPNIGIPAKQWIDLYAASGITVGTQINVKNLGTGQILLVAQLTEPNIPSAGYRSFNPYEEAVNDTGDDGAWAFSVIGTLVNVKEAS